MEKEDKGPIKLLSNMNLIMEIRDSVHYLNKEKTLSFHDIACAAFKLLNKEKNHEIFDKKGIMKVVTGTGCKIINVDWECKIKLDNLLLQNTEGYGIIDGDNISFLVLDLSNMEDITNNTANDLNLVNDFIKLMNERPSTTLTSRYFDYVLGPLVDRMFNTEKLEEYLDNYSNLIADTYAINIRLRVLQKIANGYKPCSNILKGEKKISKYILTNDFTIESDHIRINSYIECLTSTDVRDYLQLENQITFDQFLVNILDKYISEQILIKTIYQHSGLKVFKHQNVKMPDITLIFFNNSSLISEKELNSILLQKDYQTVLGVTSSIRIPENKLLEYSKSYGIIYKQNNYILENKKIWLIPIPCSQKVADIILKVIDNRTHVELESASLQEVIHYSQICGFLDMEYDV